MFQRALYFRRLAICSAAVAVLVFSPLATASVQTDLVLIVDQSSSVENCLYDFQMAAMSSPICAGACGACSDSVLPHDETVAITVIRLGIGIIGTDVPFDKVIVGSSASTLCGQIRTTLRSGPGAGTNLASALLRAKSELEERVPAPPNRVVIILSDARTLSDVDVDPRGVAAQLRTLAGTPARISAFRISDWPIGPDGGCAEPIAEEILVEVANTPDSPTYEPSQPSGVFRCGLVCRCSTAAACGQTEACAIGSPPNCHYGQDVIDAFVELVRASMCDIPGAAGEVTITQQTAQSPSPVQTGSAVTLTVDAETDLAWLSPYYQWRLDGENLIGANSSALSLAGLDQCATGPYDCVIFTPCDSVVSSAVHLDIEYTLDDCNTNALADSCEHALHYDWSGRVGGVGRDTAGGALLLLGADSFPEIGHNIASVPGGGAVYVGSVVSNTAPIDLNPTSGTDSYSSGESEGEDILVTKLTSGAPGEPEYAWSTIIATSLVVGDPTFAGSERGVASAVDPADGDIFVGANTEHFIRAGLSLSPSCVQPASMTTTAFMDLIVSKLNASGQCQWARMISHSPTEFGGDKRILKAVFDSAGDIVMCGFFIGEVDFDPGAGVVSRTGCATYNGFIAKLDGDNGDLLWVHVVCGPQNGVYSFMTSVAIDSYDNVVAVGHVRWGNTSPGVNFNPSPVCSGTPDVQLLPNSSYEVFVTRLTSSGCYEWTEVVGGASGDFVYDVAIDSRDAVILVGTYGGTSSFDAYVSKYKYSMTSDRLDLEWTRTFGGTADDAAIAVALDANDNIFAAGFYCDGGNAGVCTADFDPSATTSDTKATAGNRDIFVSQFGAGGEYIASYTMGGGAADEAHGIAVDELGSVWVSGVFRDSADFDPRTFFEDIKTAPGGGETDLFVMRLAAADFIYLDCDRDGLSDSCGTYLCNKGDTLTSGEDQFVINARDIQAFIDMLLNMPACYPDICPADMDEDGDLDMDDIPCFVATVLAGEFTCEIVPSLRGPDCNENGTADPDDIIDETSADVNTNGIPDECELDCNTNGVPDDWDIATAASADCNGNGVPDECEPDCNTNGVPDDCDVDPTDPDGDEWVSPDCNNNDYPDECDLALPPPFGSLDCNTNGIPDECDIAACESDPACDDCNENGIPDACDIAAEISEDANTNGIPDECEGESLMGGGGESSMMGGGEESMAGGDDTTAEMPLSPEDEEAAWEAFFEWSMAQCWGSDCETSGAEQFQALAQKLQMLGLPLEAMCP